MLTIATGGVTAVAKHATLRDMAEFRKLDLWKKAEEKSDAWIADKIGVDKGVFSRFRNGRQTLKMRHLLKLQEITDITPAECAEFYAEAVKERPDETLVASKKNARAPVVEGAV